LSLLESRVRLAIYCKYNFYLSFFLHNSAQNTSNNLSSYN